MGYEDLSVVDPTAGEAKSGQEAAISEVRQLPWCLPECRLLRQACNQRCHKHSLDARTQCFVLFLNSLSVLAATGTKCA